MSTMAEAGELQHSSVSASRMTLRAFATAGRVTPQRCRSLKFTVAGMSEVAQTPDAPINFH